MQNVSPYDKIRIIALYAMVKNGISDDNLVKLFTHAQIGPKEQDMVRNLVYLGVNCVTEVILKWIDLRLSSNIALFSTGPSKQELHRSTEESCERTNLSVVPLDTRHQGHHGRLHRRQIGCSTFSIFGRTCPKRFIQHAQNVSVYFWTI